MTREQAMAVLAEREGTPPEHLECCRDEDLVRAACAPEGQPCADCGALVVYEDECTDTGRGWRHVVPSGCFLGQGDEYVTVEGFTEGDRVRAVFPNSTWGEGVLVRIRTQPGMKPLAVLRDDGVQGSFHFDGAEVVR